MTSKLTEAEEQYYDDLARKAERGKLRPSGKQLRGREATEASQKLLMEATGTQTVDDATRVALGRPRLDEEEDRQPNVPWKLVAPHKLDASLENARKPRGLNRSQYIRRAVTNQIRMDLGETSSDASAPAAPENPQLLTRASRLGAEAARSEMVEPSFGTNSTTMHHPGDGTGRLALEAYRSRGVLAAVGVALAYLTAFNGALADGGRKATAQTLSRGMIHALPPDATDDEKKEIVEAIASVGD